MVSGSSSMDDVLAHQGTPSLGHTTAALCQTALPLGLTGQQVITVLGKVRTCCLGNVVGGPAQAQVGVGGVHNAGHLLLGQVALHYLYAHFVFVVQAVLAFTLEEAAGTEQLQAVSAAAPAVHGNDPPAVAVAEDGGLGAVTRGRAAACF